jgi:archaemetzincin
MKNLVFLLLFQLLWVACSDNQQLRVAQQLKPLDRIKDKVLEGDWLTEHNEMSIAFNTYQDQHPVTGDTIRKYLYLARIGSFDTTATAIADITCEYLKAFFLVDVKVSQVFSLRQIPATNIRSNGQLDAAYILDSLLYPALPADALSMIALTAEDLYPGNNWNYVFGLASLQKRVGVWSIARFTADGCKPVPFEKTLCRTLHVASHETAHMFGITHCKTYECNMNGSNSLPELDRQVPWLCHECLAKLCWNRNKKVKDHLQSMQAFYQKYLPDHIAMQYYQSALAMLRE